MNTHPPTHHDEETLKAKKAAVAGGAGKARRPVALLAAAALLIGAAAGYVLLARSADGPAASASSTPAHTGAATVSYPMDLFDDGRARHFEHRAGDITVRYFVLKSADGVIRAAFDACDVCWPSGKGYYQDGDDMVCRNCSRRFASVLVNEVKGGCNPAPLVRRVENDRLVIRVSDILEGRTYFNFSGKA